MIVNTRRTGAVLLTVVAIGGIAGCAEPRTTPARSQSAPEPADVENQALSIYQMINGTPVQRAAGEFLATYQLNRPVADCMREADVPYVWAYVNTWRDRTISSGLDWTASLGPLNARVASESVREASAAGLALEDWQRHTTEFMDGVEDRQEYQRALNRCLEESSGFEIVESRPAGWQTLYAGFQEAVAVVDTPPGEARSTYAECMDAEGFAFADDYSTLIGGLIDRAPQPSDVPPLSASTDGFSDWQGFIAQEEAAMSADDACRGSQYQDSLLELESVISAFHDDNAQQLQSLAARWDELVDRAVEWGWDPTVLVDVAG
jgi:hypothetical protein